MDNLDVFVRSARDGEPMAADNAAVALMRETAAKYRAADHDGNRLRIHLVLRNQGLADSLKRMPLADDLARDIELYAYTTEDLWAMNLLGLLPESDTRLDREPMTRDSRQFVHIVLFGAGNQSESLAMHTALTAHYPNNCLDNSLRTRITMVADSQEEFHHFQQRYRNLLVNSYRRTVTVNDDGVDCSLLVPQYAGRRRDFVDVEWEFVAGRSDDDMLQYKLQRWAQDEEQQLTIAFCYDEDDRNVSETLALPDDILNTTPVWLRVRNGEAVYFLKQSERFAQIVPFGMENAPLPDMAVFIRLAQCVNFAYHQMREVPDSDDLAVAIEPPTEQQLQELWNSNRLNTAKRWSNIYNAFTLRSKMYSLGHTPEEWGTLFAITDREAEIMAEVEHNRWSVEELVLGYRPTNEEEHAKVLEDVTLRSKFKAEFIHEDLCNFRDLGVDETGKSVVRYDVGLVRTLPLLAYTYHQLKGGSHE
jgi:hypothetical protein